MPQTKSRVVGSGNTVMYINNNPSPIAFLQTVSDQAPQPITGAIPVQPLGAQTPLEIVTPNAIGAGTMTLTLIETWNTEAWNDLLSTIMSTNVRANNVLEVYKYNAKIPSLSFTKLIKTPDGKTVRGKVYTGCVITAVDESETIANEQMLHSPTITVMYTKATLI